MRRAVSTSIIVLLATTAWAQPRPRAPVASAGGPPHAWLFGTWTGGLFPVLDGMLQQDCTQQPTVVFGKDAVGHATLTGGGLTTRIIETVRTSPAGAEFRFAPATDPDPGYGCDDANVLHVARGAGEEISFPHCTAFPYPLQRCGGR